MEKQLFENLINQITNRNLTIKSNTIDLNSEYQVYHNDKPNFIFKTPKKIDSLFSSFISQYTKKFKQPQQKYIDLFNFKNDSLYLKHHCFTESMLLSEIKQNFKNESVLRFYSKYGFYSTDYGIGIYVQFLDTKIFDSMEKYLSNNNIPFTLEFSEKEYVLRFKINVNKDFHENLLKDFVF